MPLSTATIKALLPTAAEGAKLKGASDKKDDKKEAAKPEEAKKDAPAAPAAAAEAPLDARGGLAATPAGSREGGIVNENAGSS